MAANEGELRIWNQMEQNQIFAGEVRRHSGLVRYSGVRPLDSARELQILWRQMNGMTLGDGGVATGEMLAAVREALGRKA